MTDPTRQALAEQLARVTIEYFTRVINTDHGVAVTSIEISDASIDPDLVTQVARVLAAHETVHAHELDLAHGETQRARAETARIKGIGQQFERDYRNTFEQSCKNLERAEAAEARCTRLEQQVEELKRRAESEQLHRVEAESWTVMAACIKRQREALDAAEARHSALQHERDRETELRRKAEAHAQTLVAALHEKPYADEYDDLGRDLKAVEAERDQLRTVLAETAVKHLDRAERAEAERDRLRTALETLTRQWRDNVLAIGPRLEGAAFEQCANDLEAALASPRVPASEVKP